MGKICGRSCGIYFCGSAVVEEQTAQELNVQKYGTYDLSQLDSYS